MVGRKGWAAWKVTALILFWGGAVVGGLGAMARYDNTAGAGGDSAPRVWPTSVRVQLDRTRPTLVMCLHPQCPCSRASLDELDVLLARAGGNVSTTVLFVRPQGAPADWTCGDLCRQANAIPGVHVAVDDGGNDAAALGAQDSGQTYLFDSTGKLLFSGGITDSRGHDGDSAGLAAILTLLHGQTPRTSITPVYGCSLRDGCPPGATGAFGQVAGTGNAKIGNE